MLTIRINTDKLHDMPVRPAHLLLVYIAVGQSAFNSYYEIGKRNTVRLLTSENTTHSLIHAISSTSQSLY